MNEETIIQDHLTNDKGTGQQQKKVQGSAWKFVTLGGVSGILMGAGMMYAGSAVAKESEDIDEEGQNQSASHTADNGLKVAEVDESLSFGEAFEAARAEVGPGGVFHWHGGIYNTYTADEWNSMSDGQKYEFAQQVRPEVRPEEIPTPTDSHPDLTIHHAVREETPVQEDVRTIETNTEHHAEQGEDVHIVGYTHVEGHLTVGFDTNGDNQPDVAIIDMNDNYQVDEQDLVVDDQGNMATMGELTGGTDHMQSTTMEDPDLSSAPSDYMNDDLSSDLYSV